MAAGTSPEARGGAWRSQPERSSIAAYGMARDTQRIIITSPRCYLTVSAQLRALSIMRRDSGAHQSAPVGCSALLACHSSRPARRVTANMEHGEHPDRTLSLIVKHAVREASE